MTLGEDDPVTTEIPLHPGFRPSPHPRPATGFGTDGSAEPVGPRRPDDRNPSADPNNELNNELNSGSNAELDADPDDDLFADDSWDRPRRTNRLTALLVVGLLVVAGFVAGVAVQKHHDAGLLPTGAGAAAARTRAGGGGGAGRAGGDAASSNGDRPGSSAGTPGPDPIDQQAPIVRGTVGTVAGDTLTVTDTSGAPVTVLVPQSATVTTTGLTGLVPGAPVSVQGTKGADGTITATAVDSRNPN